MNCKLVSLSEVLLRKHNVKKKGKMSKNQIEMGESKFVHYKRIMYIDYVSMTRQNPDNM